jgi:hypothetical protein
MSATVNVYNGIAFIEWSKGIQGYEFVKVPNNGDLVACNKTIYKYTANLSCPIYKSYAGSNATQGINLVGQVGRRSDLLGKLASDSIRILKFNDNQELDLFPHAHETVIIADHLKAKFSETLGATLTDAWSQKLATAIKSEMVRIKDQYGTKGVESVFGQATEAAVLRTKNPKSNMESIFRLKPFTIESTKAFLGLGSNFNSTEFQYKFGASILFNPVFTLTTIDGDADINVKIKYPSNGSPPENICAKAIIFYNASDIAFADYPSSFDFRPDDTYTQGSIEAMTAQVMSSFHDFVQADFTDAEINDIIEGANKRLKGITDGPWGNGWSSPVIIAEPRLRTKATINNPRDGKALGVFEIRFSFNFGEQDGALWLGNFLLSFVFDVQNYAQNVAAVQQARARYREMMNNLKIKADSRSVQLMENHLSSAPTTKVKLDEVPDANPDTNFATRPETVVDAVKNTSDGDIAQGGSNGLTVPPAVNAVDPIKDTNRANETNINIESDIALPGT